MCGVIVKMRSQQQLFNIVIAPSPLALSRWTLKNRQSCASRVNQRFTKVVELQRRGALCCETLVRAKIAPRCQPRRWSGTTWVRLDEAMSQPNHEAITPTQPQPWGNNKRARCILQRTTNEGYTGFCELLVVQTHAGWEMDWICNNWTKHCLAHVLLENLAQCSPSNIS